MVCRTNLPDFREICSPFQAKATDNHMGISDMLAFKSSSGRQENMIQPSLDGSLFRIVNAKPDPLGLMDSTLRPTPADICVAFRKQCILPKGIAFRDGEMDSLQRPVSIGRIHIDRLVQ
jgi:hypothetical protein